MTPGHKNMPRGRNTVTPGHEKVTPGHKKVTPAQGTKRCPGGAGLIPSGICNMLKYKLKESALANVNRTDVLSKSIHLGVN